ncbi:MAG TPA: hypothetical protein VFN55_18280 [Solirubrobacteraceae bacterium]|nr:hypothetical protein [Solirubrobacteraceae bacterium]
MSRECRWSVSPLGAVFGTVMVLAVPASALGDHTLQAIDSIVLVVGALTVAIRAGIGAGIEAGIGAGIEAGIGAGVPFRYLPGGKRRRAGGVRPTGQARARAGRLGGDAATRHDLSSRPRARPGG